MKTLEDGKVHRSSIVIKGKKLPFNISYSHCEPVVTQSGAYPEITLIKEYPDNPEGEPEFFSNIIQAMWFRFVFDTLDYPTFSGEHYTGKSWTEEDLYESYLPEYEVEATVSDIVWDTDDADIIASIPYLPKEVNINCVIGWNEMDKEWEYDEVTDYVSDKYGYCIKSCTVDIHTPDPKSFVPLENVKNRWAVRFVYEYGSDLVFEEGLPEEIRGDMPYAPKVGALILAEALQRRFVTEAIHQCVSCDENIVSEYCKKRSEHLFEDALDVMNSIGSGWVAKTIQLGANNEVVGTFKNAVKGEDIVNLPPMQPYSKTKLKKVAFKLEDPITVDEY